MPNFVDDLTDLDFPKTTGRPTAPGRESSTLRAADWNSLCQAAVDLRGAVVDLRNGGSSTSKSVVSFGAVGDFNPATGIGTDNRTAFINAIAWLAGAGAGGTLTIPPGNFYLSKYVPLVGLRGSKISGSVFTTITFGSDTLTTASDATAVTNGQARSGLLLKNCSNVTVENLTFCGGRSQELTYHNVGYGIFATRCTGLRILRCTSYYGASLFAQDAQFNTGAVSGNTLSFSSGVVTLTNDGDPNYAFHPGMVGRFVTVANATNQSNNGQFEIASYVSSTQIRFANALGVTEGSSPCVWAVNDGDDDTLIEECSIINARNASYTGRGGRYERCLFVRSGTPDTTGIPDEFSISGTTVTLTDANASWDAAVVGRLIKVAGATSAGNDGLFTILTVTPKTQYTPASLTYTNASGVAEVAPPGSARWLIFGGERVGRGVGSGSIAETSGIVTFTAASAIFRTDDVGKIIRLADTKLTAPQNGINSRPYVITRYISSTQIEYVTSAAADEDFSGPFSIDSYDNCKGDGVIGPVINGVASSAVGVNSLTHASTAMVVNAYAGRILTDAANRQWLIVSNTAQTFTLTGGGTPTAGLFSVAAGSTYGSTHAIYYFAGRSNIRVNGCTFRNVRTIGVKVSGSSYPIENVEISHNLFDECGSGVIAGADDAQDHVGINIHHNRLINCGLGRAGWTDQWGIGVIGARNVQITDNQLSATHDCVAAHVNSGAIGGYYGIFAGRYVAGLSQPMEDLQCQRNTFSIDPNKVCPSRVVASAIHGDRIGQRAKWRTGGTLSKFASGTQSFTISSASTGSMTRAAGSFVADGTRVGMTVTMSGFTNGGNNTSKVVASVTPSTITFTSNAGLVDETDPTSAYTSSLMTLTDGSAFFAKEDVGASITFYGAPDAGNNNALALNTKVADFTILSVTGTGTLTFSNASGVGGGVSAGTYRIKPKPGGGARRGGMITISHNEIGGYGVTGVSLISCTGPQVLDNVFNGVSACITDLGSVSPRIAGNTEIAATATGARIQVSSSTSWPVIYSNHIVNGALLGGNLNSEGAAQRSDMGVGVDSSTAIDHPLLGKRGRCKVTGGKAELVFAFGSELVDGDTIGINGVLYKYKAVSPSGGAQEFNSMSGLMALVGSGYTAEDYGTGLSGSPTTGHVRVRLNSASATLDAGYIDTINTHNETALVVLRNDTGAGESIQYARGEGIAATGGPWTAGAAAFTTTHGSDQINLTAHGLATGRVVRVSNSGGALPAGYVANTDYYWINTGANTGQLASSLANALGATPVQISDDGTGTHTIDTNFGRLVVWSPCVTRQAPGIQADNQAGVLLRPYPEKISKNAGCCMPFLVTTIPAGSEEFSWNIP